MFKMMKRSPATVGILLLSVLVTFGCSAFHEVSVVSHGDEVAKMEKPVPARTSGATSASPVVVSDFPQLEPEEGVVPTPVIPIDKPIPITPRVASPSAKDSGAKDPRIMGNL